MTIRQFALCTSSLALLTLGQVGCSNTTAPVQHGTGGKSESGGATSNGGVTGNGGSQATGGVGGVASGGSGGSGSGGATGSGGAGSGGTTASGGSKGTGGVAGSGGAGTGGATASGGSALGGTTGGGGSSGNSDGAAGGTTGSGGAGSGGLGATGGASSSGGAPGSGGATSKADGGLGGSSGTGGGTGAQHWVGTWTASPYYDSGNQPPSSLANSVLRQVTHVSLGGSQIRVQFSNLGGNGSVTITSAHVALCKATPAVDSTIDTATDKALAFSGTASVTIAQNKEVWSDPIDFAVPNQGNITITTSFGSVPSQVVGHSGSRTTSYLASGSTALNAASMTSATAFQHWYYISGIDVMADASAAGVVAIGDSITDGRGTDNDKNNRWTDFMAARLQANAATKNVATMNQGIGATTLIGTGTGAQGRFARDVLGQSGVKYAIVLDGINDIIADKSYSALKTAYDDLISQAHAKKVLIYGATITPFGGYTNYNATREGVRQQVNTYIKSGAFDGYIDFDAAVTDGGSPPKLQSTYAAWTPNNPAGSADGLHPGPEGYKKLGDTADLTLFTK